MNNRKDVKNTQPKTQNLKFNRQALHRPEQVQGIIFNQGPNLKHTHGESADNAGASPGGPHPAETVYQGLFGNGNIRPGADKIFPGREFPRIPAGYSRPELSS